MDQGLRKPGTQQREWTHYKQVIPLSCAAQTWGQGQSFSPVPGSHSEHGSEPVDGQTHAVVSEGPRNSCAQQGET